MFRFSTLTKIRKLAPGKRTKSTKSGQTSSRSSDAKRTKQLRKMEDVTACRPTPTFIPGRHWEPTRLKATLDCGQKSLTPLDTVFTLVSYNILAQDLLQSHLDLYKDIPKEHLNWNRRKSNLLNEIWNLAPDILCLQEVQSDHLESISAALNMRFTFDRVYKKRTGSEKTDGCAIFYNPDLFELIDWRTIEFNQEVPLLDRDNVAIVVKLRSRSNPEAVFIVATTHLLFNPKRSDIKLAQVHVLLAELEQMSFNKNYKDRYYPIILTGDFNMEPTSAPYSLITDGRINYQELPQKKPIISEELGITDNCQHIHSIKYGRNEDQSQLIHREKEATEKRKMDPNSGYENLFNTGYLSHPLHLTTTYRNYSGRSSTHHHDWIIVDYLFYSRYFNQKLNRIIEGPLKLLSYLELPATDDCQRMRKMPNETIGSDHFSLAARFILGSSS